jgi:hypothetical protein
MSPYCASVMQVAETMTMHPIVDAEVFDLA